ncbi:MAG: DUF1850 domain-containing protein [Clostridiales bacterium]|nr:DUF1850 domain-containing protein [Clostridiales bacterium]
MLSNIKNMDRGIGSCSNTSIHYKKTLVILILLVLLVMISQIPIKVLLAVDYKTGEYLKSWPIKTDDRFEIEYTHSVQLTPVIEIYIIDKENNIILEESYFYSYGAGLPSTTPYDFEITDKGFRIYNINQIMDELVYRTGAERAEHRIKIYKNIYPFLDFSKPRTGVKFTVKRFSILSYLIKEVL